MTYTIWQVIANTPWWVFLVFILIVRVGLLATKARTIPVKNLFIIPAIFFVMTLVNMYFFVSFTLLNLSIWLSTLLLGLFAGWLQFRSLNIKALKNEAKLVVPGTWSLLVILLTIFVIKYYAGYQFVIDPEVLKQPKYVYGLLTLYGLFTGLFIGRLLYSLRCLKYGPYHHLS